MLGLKRVESDGRIEDEDAKRNKVSEEQKNATLLVQQVEVETNASMVTEPTGEEVNILCSTQYQHAPNNDLFLDVITAHGIVNYYNDHKALTKREYDDFAAALSQWYDVLLQMYDKRNEISEVKAFFEWKMDDKPLMFQGICKQERVMEPPVCIISASAADTGMMADPPEVGELRSVGRIASDVGTAWVQEFGRSLLNFRTEQGALSWVKVLGGVSTILGYANMSTAAKFIKELTSLLGYGITAIKALRDLTQFGLLTAIKNLVFSPATIMALFTIYIDFKNVKEDFIKKVSDKAAWKQFVHWEQRRGLSKREFAEKRWAEADPAGTYACTEKSANICKLPEEEQPSRYVDWCPIGCGESIETQVEDDFRKGSGVLTESRLWMVQYLKDLFAGNINPGTIGSMVLGLAGAPITAIVFSASAYMLWAGATAVVEEGIAPFQEVHDRVPERVKRLNEYIVVEAMELDPFVDNVAPTDAEIEFMGNDADRWSQTRGLTLRSTLRFYSESLTSMDLDDDINNEANWLIINRPGVGLAKRFPLTMLEADPNMWTGPQKRKVFEDKERTLKIMAAAYRIVYQYIGSRAYRDRGLLTKAAGIMQYAARFNTASRKLFRDRYDAAAKTWLDEYKRELKRQPGGRGEMGVVNPLLAAQPKFRYAGAMVNLGQDFKDDYTQRQYGVPIDSHVGPYQPSLSEHRVVNRRGELSVVDAVFAKLGLA